MWEQAPGNSRVNLELARLAARMGDDADARRYYNGAIYGVWDESADARCCAAGWIRAWSFIRYLMGRGENTEAQSVLLATAAGDSSGCRHCMRRWAD